MTFFEVFWYVEKDKYICKTLYFSGLNSKKKKKDFLRNQSIKKLKNLHVFWHSFWSRHK